MLQTVRIMSVTDIEDHGLLYDIVDHGSYRYCGINNKDPLGDVCLGSHIYWKSGRFFKY